jgi:superfamily II DNA or RNA helicase
MGQSRIVADVVGTWLKLAERRPTLCFAVDRAHARTLQDSFEAAGVATGYVDANTPKAEREAVRRAFADGRLSVVCNVGVLTTGVDWDVRCIVLARPTKSEILFTQIVGRGLRAAEGKDHCLILDHSDTTLRLGFVTDIRHTRLDGGGGARLGGEPEPERAEPKPKECPQCHYVRAARLSHCPACGHVPMRSANVENVAGELVDLSAQRKANTAEWAEKVAFMAQLKAYAIQTGKKDGWIAHKYRAKFGVWPNDQRVKYAKPAAAVSPEVRSWITAQNIRYAKGREKASARW